MNKKQIRLQIGRLLDEHCQECEQNKVANNKYCASECDIGKHLLSLGEMIDGPEEKRGRPRTIDREELTKEQYMDRKKQSIADSVIIAEFKICPRTLSKKKAKWGIPVAKPGMGSEQYYQFLLAHES